jgi:hypothetical protein
VYIVHNISQENQKSDIFSYVGGKPMLPSGVNIPLYESTGNRMTFFFQFCFPEDHKWSDKIVSVFCVTDYASEETLLPKLPDPLKGASLTRNFFDNYYSFFRFFVFSKRNSKIVEDYLPIIEFHELKTSNGIDDTEILFGEIDKEPNWILEDESPGDFEGETSQPIFLFQTKVDYEFQKLPNAPRQRVIDYGSSVSAHTDSYAETYSLFVANELYFFGIQDGAENEIYLVPQS